MVNAAAPPYQEAPERAGYQHKLEFAENVADNDGKRKRKQKRDITFFNPPFNLDVKTKIGREFLKIVDSSFPVGNPLHGKLNRHNLKISYSTTSNMRSLISRHNTRLLSGAGAGAGAVPEQLDPCVCRDFPCPLDGNCEVHNCIYQATVNSDDGRTETYVGVTNYFKKRFVAHRATFNRRPDPDKGTTLSSYIWKLKDENKQFNVTWKIIDRGPTYNPITKKCLLCIRESFHIIFDNPTLNRRTELFNPCRHRLSELLCKQK